MFFERIFKREGKIKKSELMNLDLTIIKWLVPRLEAFRAQTQGYPGDISEEEWDAVLGRIIDGLGAYVQERKWDNKLSKEENLTLDKSFYAAKEAEFKEAMGLLAKHFRSLWW